LVERSISLQSSTMSCVSGEGDGAALLDMVLHGGGLWGMCWRGVRGPALSSSSCSSAPVSEGVLELGACCWGGRIPPASITERWLLFLILAGVRFFFPFRIPLGRYVGGPCWVGSRAGVTCFTAALLWESSCGNVYCLLRTSSGQPCCLLPG